MAQSSDELIIFTASSLTDAFNELSEQFEIQNDVKITINIAGSSTLAAQLLQGAPADIFASANLEQLDALIDQGLIDSDTISIFAENELVIITPIDNPANIQSAQDLAQDGILLVLAAPNVPIREYSNQLFNNLLRFYGDDYQFDVLDNLVSEESNVRQITARIALGEADVGVVYRSDVTPDMRDLVHIVDVPVDTSPRAMYPIAPIIDAENAINADLFIDFVLSEAGQSILRNWGFCTPKSLRPELTPEVEMTVEVEITSDIDESQDPETSC